ncbi:MAG: cytochrome c oxidase subunit 3 [Flavobacteriaceae bacterium]|nr:cytochrome c oxidase subunit 3 [Flavobacteriaceae bacterium]
MNTTKINHKNIYYPPGGILMWIIIFLELITFGIALIVLAVSSKENPVLFHTSSTHLNTTYGAINTVFLLTSGFFMATAVHQFKLKDFKKSSFYLKLTMLGGILFLLLKTIEYNRKIALGFVLGYDTFFNFYWLLTGFHVIHVIVGLVILLFMHRSLKKDTALLEDVEASAAFWHMCDLIWLLLFPVLYLIF